MIAEALKHLETLAKTAAAVDRPQFVAMQQFGEPAGVYAVVQADGSYELMDASRPARAAVLSTLDDLVEFVQYAKTLGHAPAIYYEEVSAIAVLNDHGENQRETAEVPLQFSEAFEIVRGEGTFDQRGLVRHLRTTLYDCFEAQFVDALIKQVRTLTFAESATGRSDIQHGRDALGKEVRQGVTGGENNVEFPERLTFSTHVLTDPSLTSRCLIRCALDVNAREQTFRFLPIGNDVDQAIQKTMNATAAILAAAEVPTFRGRP